MGQVFKDTWTSVSKKPKGFKCVKPKFYQYEILMQYSVDGKTYFNPELLTVEYKYNAKSNSLKIDMVKIIKTIKDKLGIIISDSYIEKGYFHRDSSTFSIIEVIEIPRVQVKRYIQYKKLRERVEKVNKLKHKIKVI